MKKLRLNLEQLAVESFDTAAAGANEGTVPGYELLETDTSCRQRICDRDSYDSDCGSCATDCTCGGYSCGATMCADCAWSPQPSCAYSCQGTCDGQTCTLVVE